MGSFLSEHKAVGSLLSTVVTGFALSKVSASIAKDSASSTSGGGSTPQVVASDYGVTIQVPANQDNKIPVFYGKATVPGIVTEAVMSNSRQTMTYVLTIAEKTGNTNLGAGAASTITFNKIYWDGKLVNFDTDGITAVSLTDPDGNVDTNINGLVKIYCYAGSTASGDQKAPSGYSISPIPADNIVPNWTINHTMNELIFVVVKVNYNKTKGVTGIPNMNFQLTNSMNQPGDCLYDYMTNTRYGAGITPTDIST